MVVLGLSNMRDAAAALVDNGRIIAAAEEERFARTKHVTALPVGAIRYCLQQAGVRLCDLDAVAVPWKFWQIGRRVGLAVGSMLRSPQLFLVKGKRSAERSVEWKELALLRRTLSNRIDGTHSPAPVFLDHHICHAASAVLTAPFDSSAVLVADGASEAHTTTLARAGPRRIDILKRVRLPHSLGQFYAAITAYLGFKPDQDEYIVMGLAAYGEPLFARQLGSEVLKLLPDGAFQLNTGLLDFHLARERIFVRQFVDLFGPARLPGEDVTQRHRDMAASAQLVIENTLLHLARHLKASTRDDRLCLVGGVAYNCVANSRIFREAGFREVYVPPAAGDSGAALGAALWLSSRRGADADRTPMKSAAWGPEYDDAVCRRELEGAGLCIEHLPDDMLFDKVAGELANGRLVCWFQGRMEWGPRALGNRSLLADPRREDMRALINAKVKLREPFRPFAPSVLKERVHEFFDLPCPSPFMAFTAPVLAAAKGSIPAVLHVDGTARVQTVDESNPRYRALLEAFDRRTGVPVLLNTSFNVNEPIVCTPADAVRCFLRTDVDWLVMGNLLASRPLVHRVG
ncbi:carbamoyltransferase [Nitrospira sp. KM1]|uniref:carbamoyltransferase family protein n=1 Tax=Nitrospira sp. KM1 TaxID=1936990 RepID=UPI0013A789D5|nr:carbamoyltransferase C-terminal domain-containing protein [Nitrospira sp. KM1]BCA54396.1 carbamoyltransferase [Nitrospira sp. KM1]